MCVGQMRKERERRKKIDYRGGEKVERKRTRERKDKRPENE